MQKQQQNSTICLEVIIAVKRPFLKTTLTLGDIFPHSSRIWDVLVPDSFSKVNTLYPSTFEFEIFRRVNGFCKDPDIWETFGNPKTLLM